MKFETLKKYHLCTIEVTLNSGEVHLGVITSHSFEDDRFEKISEISLMKEWSIEKILCKEIKDIKKVT